MKKFIFGERSGIYIIDLEKTEECLNKARDFLFDTASKGEVILFVGTKKQAQEVVKQEALRCGMYYVTERWPGGLLTNFATIKKSIALLKDIERMKEDGTINKFTKKEQSKLEKELTKLKKNFSGISQMENMPKAAVIIDTQKEDTAVKEARRLSIPIVGLLDTNSNPDLVNYPIPGNDDATKSIKLAVSLLAESIIEGRKKFLSYLSESGVALKSEKEEIPLVLPEEEVKIKEIEELVEDTGTTDGKLPVKKARGVKVQDDKLRNKKK